MVSVVILKTALTRTRVLSIRAFLSAVSAQTK